MFEKARLIAVTVTAFSGTTTADKNGKMPVMLQLLAGKMPNRQVMAGTVAERNGFEIGKSYLVQVRLRGVDDEFGDDFNWLKTKELSALEIIDCVDKLGVPEVIEVPRPEGFEEKYQRKGDAVEGIQTIREKEGLYHRVGSSSTVRDHRTAREVKAGTSTVSDAPVNLGGADPNNASGDKDVDRGGSRGKQTLNRGTA